MRTANNNGDDSQAKAEGRDKTSKNPVTFALHETISLGIAQLFRGLRENYKMKGQQTSNRETRDRHLSRPWVDGEKVASAYSW